MDLVDRVRQLSERIARQKEHCTTEESAKTAFVLPFLQALGYDVFDPTEVTPEFVADVGTKKGEKVDYAISINEEIQMLIECKPIGSKLELQHASQLYRYFSVTSARFGVLSDGIRYCFYTDLDAANKMDDRPFFVLDLEQYKEGDIANLKKFSKEAFDLDAIISTAADMKYQRALADELKREFAEPSEDFTRIIASRVYSGRFTQQVAERFSSLLKRAISDYVRERVDSRLKGALEARPQELEEDIDEAASGDDDGVVTSAIEIDGFKVVRAIASECVDPTRIVMRDSKSYCAVLFDNNNRKPVVRLHFNNETRLRLQVFDVDNPDRIEINSVPDIYQYKEKIKSAVRRYTGEEEPAKEHRTDEDTISESAKNL